MLFVVKGTVAFVSVGQILFTYRYNVHLSSASAADLCSFFKRGPSRECCLLLQLESKSHQSLPEYFNISGVLLPSVSSNILQ